MKTILVDAINTFVIKDEGVFKQMYTLLEKYPNRKIILTNADDEQMKVFGLDKMPYEVFTLKHNPDKIDPKYYQEMLKHFGLSPQEVIYFEHNVEAVESARSVGINVMHYDSESRDLIALEEFLNTNLKEI